MIMIRKEYILYIYGTGFYFWGCPYDLELKKYIQMDIENFIKWHVLIIGLDTYRERYQPKIIEDIEYMQTSQLLFTKAKLLSAKLPSTVEHMVLY